MGKRRMPEKRIGFARAFAGEAKGDATKAAKIAGYAGDARSLSSQGLACLRDPRVQRMIADLAAKTAQEDIATIKEVQSTLTDILRDVEAAPKDRIRAGVEICKMRGAYIQRVEVTGAGGGPIETRQRLPVGDLADETLADLEAALLKRAGEP